ncbi:MAG: DUF1573 domain-containing protein, partial [Pirellulaceae bacterium]|nr:DUF1573 domain-containing protein [Pirellulaceae bacterium]
MNSTSLTLGGLNEEITHNLGDLRADREYRINLQIKNKTDQRLTTSRIQTSCGCIKATTEIGKPVATENEFTVALSISTTEPKPFERTVTLLTKNDDEERPFATVRLTANVVQVVKIAPTNIVLNPDEESRLAEFKLLSNFADVSFKDTQLELESAWSSGGNIVQKTQHEVLASLRIVPEKRTDTTAQMFAKLTYVDKDGFHTAEIPIYLSRREKLTAFPEKLK